MNRGQLLALHEQTERLQAANKSLERKWLLGGGVEMSTSAAWGGGTLFHSLHFEPRSRLTDDHIEKINNLLSAIDAWNDGVSDNLPPNGNF